MEYSVPIATIVVLIFDIVASAAMVVGLFLFLRRRFQSPALPFFIGAGVFILFATILESLVHQVVFTQTAIAQSLLPLAIYAAAMAAIFEEGGRYLAFRTILKDRSPTKGEALMAGAGHGGAEVLIIFTITMVANLYYALMLNRGGAPALLGKLEGQQLLATQSIFATLSVTPPALFLVGLFERLVAVVLHLSFSLLVWLSVQKSSKRYYLWIALILHFAVDFVTVLLSQNGSSILLIEVIAALFALGSFAYAIREVRSYEAEQERVASETLLSID